VLLAGVIGLVAGLSVWAVWSSGRRVDELQRRLTDAHLARFRLADEFQRRLLALNNSMLRLIEHRDPEFWSDFTQASRELDQGFLDRPNWHLTRIRKCHRRMAGVC
jgi:hypothetical protein